MSESEFAKTVVRRLALQGCRVLRICDGTDSRHGNYGLRALTSPAIHATGADYLVVPRAGMQTLVTNEWGRSQDKYARTRTEPFFVELKAPDGSGRVHRDQERWIDWVAGGVRWAEVER